MDNKFLEAEGQLIAIDALRLRRSRELAGIAKSGRLAFVKLVECRQTTHGNQFCEVVVVDVEVERPQRVVHPVSRIERISVRFIERDDWYPEVLSLRSDFPEVPHLNLRDEELPRSLCLYDQPWSEIAIRWTATNFAERIRTWLAETAKGTLHQDDQPLEPVIAGSGLTVILPADLYQNLEGDGTARLRIGFATNENNCAVLSARADTGRSGGLPVFTICLTALPRQQAAIRKRPKTLKELHDLLQCDTFDLLEQLSSQLALTESDIDRKSRLLIVLGFPLRRGDAQTIEVIDTWAFISNMSVAEVGIAIGVWMRMPGSEQLGAVMGTPSDTSEDEVKLDVVATQFRLSRESAAKASGIEPDTRKVLAIGAGALGSQVIRLLAQSGFGTWTIVDSDWLAPHNIARHALPACWIGWSKARALAAEVEQLYGDEVVGVACDFIDGSQQNDQLKQSLAESDLILDISASVPVARHLVRDVASSGRRASLFLNPSGTDLVLMFEDQARELPLDCLEMQYYREIAFNEQLTKHLAPPANRIRYARSCRDVSSSMPNHLVAMHASIAANGIRNVVKEDEAKIIVWQSQDFPTELRHVNVPISPVTRKQIGDWSLVITDDVVSKLSMFRESKLPNETGGVLIGSYDLVRRIVYVVDTVASPSDSKEWPTAYIRGSKGLPAEVDRIIEVTDGQLEYVGEWHSHPDGASCHPSDDDLELFAWLTSNMGDAGLPALMAISGQTNIAWFLGKIFREGGWEMSNNG